jgi:hypothetical protein
MHAIKCRRLRRVEASAYLNEKWGIARAPSTLAKLACIGGGPRFESANRTPLYREDELDTWAQSILSPLKHSTSDARHGAALKKNVHSLQLPNAKALSDSCESTPPRNSNELKARR